MRNERHFAELIPVVLRSVPYILQSHGCKGYLALENLRVEHPRWADEVWAHGVSVLRDDEPKVEHLIAAELLDRPAFVDPTSGRDFGPDWVLERGLMPLSYWAMRKKMHAEGVEAVLRAYLTKALDHPIYLGHELSVLASYWLFYRSVLAVSDEPTWLEFFTQRFTEFAHVTFDQRNAWVFEHPKIDQVPTERDLLREALENPGFFGHNVLAYVWVRRLRDLMTPDEHRKALYNLTVLVRWVSFDGAGVRVEPLPCPDDERDFEDRVKTFFAEGPRNIHQVTLADALSWVWRHHPEYRGHCAANLATFTRATRPK